ncbi:MAG: hypothetical protein FWG70_00510 [Oscillospiraceae bacterium]|nr:hypothetical protein [Oscillospiraceae bacterium]
MAYDTKVLLASLANNILKSETVKEAYTVIMEIANVEGLNIQPYDEAMEKLEELRK